MTRPPLSSDTTVRPRWSILYRGPLTSCNYACGYCPFAKRRNTRAELLDDARKLARFVAWAAGQPESIGILITPWGEALHHAHYQEAMCCVSWAPNTWKVAIQTNLSAPLTWLAGANPDRVGIWATWHPGEVEMDRFLEQCGVLERFGVSFSAGVVGIREHFDAIERLRAALAPVRYLWINAFKDVPAYYTDAEVERLSAIDPHFTTNLRDHASLGASCRAGVTSFAVDGDGDMRRCHFIRPVIGNIYDPNFRASLFERPCTNLTCGCHIGYVHLDRLEQYALYGDGLLERARARDP